jgi:hypothetical protein
MGNGCIPQRMLESPLPVEKCSGKTIAFGIVTNPNRIHSGVGSVRWLDLAGFIHGASPVDKAQTERERLFHQNMTGRSRHRIVHSPNLRVLGCVGG